MRFVKNYVGILGGAAMLATIGVAYISKESPLEPGFYKGTINENPAILQVRSVGGKRDCILETPGKDNKVQRNIDYFCNDKAGPHKEARSWIGEKNKVSFEEAQKYLER